MPGRHSYDVASGTGSNGGLGVGVDHGELLHAAHADRSRRVARALTYLEPPRGLAERDVDEHVGDGHDDVRLQQVLAKLARDLAAAQELLVGHDEAERRVL